MKSTRLIVALVIGISLLVPSTAYAGGGSIAGAMETTQLRNEAELVSANATFAKQLTQQINQLKTQIQMYSQMVKNAIPLTVTDIFKLSSELQELASIAKDVNGLYNGATDMQTYLENEYKQLTNINSYTSAKEFSNLQSSLKKKNQNTLKATAKLADTMSKQSGNHVSAIENALTSSRNAQGTQQALQAGNELAAQTAAELVELNKLTQLQLERIVDAETQRQIEEEAFNKKQKLMFQQRTTDGLDIRFDDIKFNN